MSKGINTSAATTAELLAFFNAHSGKPVKKFADRKTAERRVNELLATMKAASSDSPTRAASIAQSWRDPATRASRAEKNKVTADGVEYGSVRKAFAALGLPDSKHIKFRGALKLAGKLNFEGHKFVVIRD
jgi:hypothetical protein